MDQKHCLNLKQTLPTPAFARTLALAAATGDLVTNGSDFYVLRPTQHPEMQNPNVSGAIPDAVRRFSDLRDRPVVRDLQPHWGFQARYPGKES
jgi:hypothetical protein